MSKRLTKSRTNKVLTGTLAGIAEYFRIDPTIVRVIYVVLILLGWGSPIILYIVLACLIPSAPGTTSSRTYYDRNQQNNRPGQNGHPYYSNSSSQPKRKEAKKVDDDDWSDF